MASGLFGYYSTPLMFGFFWPLLLLRRPPSTPGERRFRLIRLQTVMAISSTLLLVLIGTVAISVGRGGAYIRTPWLYVLPPSPYQIAATERFLSSLRESPQFSYLIVDDGVASLLMGAVRKGQYRAWLDYSDSEIAQAAGFVRFLDDDEDAPAVESRLIAHFPRCRPINGTALEQCQ